MQRRNFVLIFFSFDTKMYDCMTTMPIDNHPLTQRRLQFIGIGANKLTLKSINIIQSSNNYNIENPGYGVLDDENKI